MTIANILLALAVLCSPWAFFWICDRRRRKAFNDFKRSKRWRT